MIEQILTPLKFTPFTNQAIANHRCRGMTNTGYSEMLSLNNRKNSQGEQVRTITIKSRLSDTIRFQSLNGVHSIFENNPKKEKVEDSFDRFSEMYQWLKECINELTISEVNVRS